MSYRRLHAGFIALVISMLSLSPPAAAAHGKVLDPNNIDASIDARQDFYHYANGGWLKRTTIPAAYGRWGSFEVLDVDVKESLRGIAEGAANAPNAPGSVAQKVGDFYKSGMNEAQIQAEGARALKPLLEQVAAVHDATSFAACVGYLHNQGIDALFDFTASPDDKNSKMVIARQLQGGLGLPNRDYYFDAGKAPLREAYVKHIAASLKLIGESSVVAAKNADKILALETALAHPSYSPVERRDPHRTYNIRRVTELEHEPKAFAWRSYFDALGVGDPNIVNVENTGFVTSLGETVQAQPVDVLRAYLTWNVIRDMSSYLSDEFVNEHFHFYEETLNGTKALQPRYRRVLSAADGLLGEALGQLYVAKHFPPASKDRAQALVAGLRGTLHKMIGELPWMGAATKTRALEKLDRLNVKIGYPNKWIDYGSVTIKADSYAGNVLRAGQFNVVRELNRINKPVDRELWEMTPQTVNAYYEPALNEIVFPAAILQYPFFDAAADDAFNYGGIGAVIGHEMTHGYDDQGRQYDADGNMNDWWTAEDAAQFNARAALIISQYGNYQLFGEKVNGSLTQGENIADLGGVKIAFRALQEAIAHSHPPTIDGFTAEQRFFLAFAQVWRNQIRKETALKRLANDPHSPGEFRVKGPLSNLPEFYTAFGVRPGDSMHRADAERVSIW